MFLKKIKLCKDKLCKKLYKDETVKMLNYLTLQISDLEVAQDLANHQTHQQNRPFIAAQLITLINLIFHCYSSFISKKTIGTGDVIVAVNALIFATVFWSVSYFRCKSLTKYIFSLWFLVTVSLHLATAFADAGNIMNVQSGIEHSWIMLTVDFIVVMTTGSYCEFKLCLFLYVPVYLTATLIIIKFQVNPYDSMEQKNQDLRYLLPENQLYNRLSNSMMISILLLVKKYSQRLDVCYLVIKKWIIYKQQAQLITYFQSKNDGIVIYYKSNADSELSSQEYQVQEKFSIQFFNQSFTQLVGFERIVDSTTNNTYKIPEQILNNKICQVQVDSENDLLNNENNESISLAQLLNEHSKLVQTGNLVVHMNSQNSLLVQLIHQKLNFNNKECQILQIRDISASSKLEKSENQNALNNLLTSSVSHELLTPIRGITFIGNQLLETVDSDTQQKVQLIVNVSKLLDTQVQMLLDRSLMENQQFSPQLANEKLLPVILESIEILSGQASLKKIDFQLKAEFDHDLWLIIDQMRMKQILLNLVSNAIKFSYFNGVVQIQVCVQEADGNRVEVRMIVRDYGIGLNEEDKKNLFKPYFKTTDQQSKNLNSKSNGLGLYICNKIANSLHGQILVHSNQGEGSTFTFYFIAEIGQKVRQYFQPQPIERKAKTLVSSKHLNSVVPNINEICSDQNDKSKTEQVLIKSNMILQGEPEKENFQKQLCFTNVKPKVEIQDDLQASKNMEIKIEEERKEKQSEQSQTSSTNQYKSQKSRQSQAKKVSQKKNKFVPKIIIADDQQINLEVIKSLIQKLGLMDSTIFCFDGQQVIDVFKTEIDSCVDNIDYVSKVKPVLMMLLDFQMPKKNGIQVVQETKQYFHMKQKQNLELLMVEPTIVFLTAFKSQVFLNHLMKFGITNCFEKPLPLQQLKSLIDISVDF